MKTQGYQLREAKFLKSAKDQLLPELSQEKLILRLLFLQFFQ